jgi:hypothetical protein
MDLEEGGWSGIDWTDLDQEKNQCRALVNMVINLLVP